MGRQIIVIALGIALGLALFATGVVAVERHNDAQRAKAAQRERDRRAAQAAAAEAARRERKAADRAADQAAIDAWHAEQNGPAAQRRARRADAERRRQMAADQAAFDAETRRSELCSKGLATDC
jgi:hypothetical protein